MSFKLANSVAYRVHFNGGARIHRISFALLAMAFSLIAPARAAIYTYDLEIDSYMTNNNPSVFGTGGHSTVSFDNGNLTNQNQTYTYADIVNATATSVGGTFTITSAQPKAISYTGINSHTYATTDAQGNLILPPPFLEFNVDNDATIFTVSNGDQISMSAWWFTGRHQSRRTAAGDSALGGLSVVPEPSTWAMTLVGFAGLGLAYGRTRIRRG